MTVSLTTTPGTYSAVNAPLWFQLSSASFSLTEFNYVVDLEALSEPLEGRPYEVEQEYILPARPDNGRALFSPHSILKARIGFANNPYQDGLDSVLITGATVGVPDQLVSYRIGYGLRYNPNLPFVRTFQSGTALGLSFSVPHNLIVNDEIIVSKNNLAQNPQYNGPATVNGLVGTSSVTLNIPFGVTYSNESGTIVSLKRMYGTSSIYYTWNATKQWQDKNKDFNLYKLGTQSGAASKFMTTYPRTDPKPVLVSSNNRSGYETLSMIMPATSSCSVYLEFYRETDPTTILFDHRYDLPNDNRYRRIDLGIGPQNLRNDLSINWDTADYDSYRVYVKQGAFTASETLRYKTYRHCVRYGEQRVMIQFLNRIGGFDYFTFLQGAQRDVSIQRKTFEKVLPFDYQIGEPGRRSDRGNTVYNQVINQNYTAYTDWVTDEEAAWLEELFTSPEVYIVEDGEFIRDFDPEFPSGFTGKRIPIVITDSSYKTRTYDRDGMVSLTIRYSLAHDVNIQNQ